MKAVFIERHGGPDRATGDPRAVNEASAIYGNPDDIAKKLEELREAGVGYVLINGGGSGGGIGSRDGKSGVWADMRRTCTGSKTHPVVIAARNQILPWVN